MLTGPEPVTFSFEDAPELKAALERHLDPIHERSLAIRAVYGRFLPQLHALDDSWTTDNLAKIFPREDALKRFREAAWESYVLWARFDLAILGLLREEYEVSIGLIAATSPKEQIKMEKRMGEHLMALYWHGKLDLTDSLLEHYFESASDNVRGEALGWVGRNLRNAYAPSPDVTQRLRELWEWRAEVAARSELPEHVDEMAAFGWWFPSDELDEAWALEQLEKSLTIAGKADVDHQVSERLATLALHNPAAAVRCLTLMVDGATEDWRIHIWSSDAKFILSSVLRGSHDEAKKDARALINRLAARGFLDFGQLLKDT